jgi:hypothetical protein
MATSSAAVGTAVRKMAAENLQPANPSQITQQAIDKAIDSAVSVLTARLDAMEKAQDLFQADLTRVPTTVDRQITALRDLIEQRFSGMDADIKGIHKALDGRDDVVTGQIDHLHALMLSKVDELASVTTERFLGVAAQFSERDTRTDQRAGDTKLAVDAAFAAAKEATAKIEAGFTKQIDAMINIIDTKTANLAGGLGDLKDRMTAMENRTAGITSARGEGRVDSSDSRALLLGVCGVAIAAAAFLVAVMTYISHLPPH